MAVDFTLLPEETPAYNRAPSRRSVIVVFLVMVLAGATALLVLWPAQQSTQTWKFWVSLALFPIGIPAVLVMRWQSLHAGRRLDTEVHNDLVRQYRERVNGVAARPLALLGAAYRFSSDPEENAVESLRTGRIRLVTRQPVASAGDPVKARWLSLPDVESVPGDQAADCGRQQALTRWLYEALIDEMTEHIRLIPAKVDLVVHLCAARELGHQACADLWTTCWQQRRLRAMRCAAEDASCDLATLDGWLDQIAGGNAREARLIVATRLHLLLSESPPPGSAEAGAAVLLMPVELAQNHQLRYNATVHRPVRSLPAAAKDNLSHALRWGGVAPADVSQAWQTGMNAAQTGVFRVAASQLDLPLLPADLDTTVGHAGSAAPWLAIALAANALVGKDQNQLVLAGSGENVDIAVVRRTPHGVTT